MKKCIFSLMLLLSFGLVIAMDYVPGTHESVVTDIRTYSFGYHNGTDDYHWYGSAQWAVRYDFRAEYPSIAMSRFSVSGASVFFPVTGDSVTVDLFTDANGQPQQRVARVRTLVDQNFMQFNFGTTLQTDVIWLVLSYDTSYLGPYMAASIGGGTHSYYLNTNVTDPYFQSMSAAGFNCEFLMNITGDFLLSSEDLELSEALLQGDLLPQTTAYPKFTIYNHTNTTINNTQIELTISSPSSAGFTHQAVIPITEPIPSHSQYIVDATQPLYSAQQFILHRDPMQIKLRAVLSSADAVSDTLFNNTLVRYYNIFQSPIPALITENFIRNSETLQMAGLQEDNDSPDLHRLQYFPLLSDSLSSIGSVQRYSWYSLFSTPVTIMNGNSRINGITADYQTDFTDLLSTYAEHQTFISNAVCTLTLPTQGENLSININLTNASTHLFNTSTEPSLPINSRLFVAFFKRTYFEDTPLYVFNRWIAFGDTISTNLFLGQTARKNYSTSLSNIDLVDLAQNYRLYYWIQKNNSGEIYYANYKDFSTELADEDPLVVPTLLRAYPNPFSGTELHLAIASKASLSQAKLSIFNLRGQLIWTSGSLRDEQLNDLSALPAKLFPTNGIYLLRLDYLDSRGIRGTQTQKISYIK